MMTKNEKKYGKLVAERQAEIEPVGDKYQVRLVTYYHNADTVRTSPRGTFKTYEEAHDFAMWWKKQK